MAALFAAPVAAEQHFHEEQSDVPSISLVINAGSLRYAITHPSTVTQIGDDFRLSLTVKGPPASTNGQSTVSLQVTTLHGCVAESGTGDVQDTGSISNGAGTSRSVTQRFTVTDTMCSGVYRSTVTAGASNTVIGDRFLSFSVSVVQPTFTFFAPDSGALVEGESVRACSTTIVTGSGTVQRPDASTFTVAPDGDGCFSWPLGAQGSWKLTYTGGGTTRTMILEAAPFDYLGYKQDSNVLTLISQVVVIMLLFFAGIIALRLPDAASKFLVVPIGIVVGLLALTFLWGFTFQLVVAFGGFVLVVLGVLFGALWLFMERKRREADELDLEGVE